MKRWNEFLEDLKRSMQEFEEGFLLGTDEQYETGDETSQTGFKLFLLAAFAFASLAWAVAYMFAANAGYIQ
jgi:hypothetical protein